MKRFANDHVASLKLSKEGQADKKRGNFKAAYSAEALCLICGSANHDPRQCRMLTTALADYKSKHLLKGKLSRGVGGSRNHTLSEAFIGLDYRHAINKVNLTTTLTLTGTPLGSLPTSAPASLTA
jgi:hypothetical protein